MAEKIEYSGYVSTLTPYDLLINDSKHLTNSNLSVLFDKLTDSSFEKSAPSTDTVIAQDFEYIRRKVLKLLYDRKLTNIPQYRPLSANVNKYDIVTSAQVKNLKLAIEKIDFYDYMNERLPEKQNLFHDKSKRDSIFVNDTKFETARTNEADKFGTINKSRWGRKRTSSAPEVLKPSFDYKLNIGDLIIKNNLFDMAKPRAENATLKCPCNCNYSCTCNCNYCSCQCNYSCTCNCNYAYCSCQCNYSCTCNCNYSCTCNCNYAGRVNITRPEQVTLPGSSSCTCNCNYTCTCQCNYSCTCQCNYR